jgi:hypothetical protein
MPMVLCSRGTQLPHTPLNASRSRCDNLHASHAVLQKATGAARQASGAGPDWQQSALRLMVG